MVPHVLYAVTKGLNSDGILYNRKVCHLFQWYSINISTNYCGLLQHVPHQWDVLWVSMTTVDTDVTTGCPLAYEVVLAISWTKCVES